MADGSAGLRRLMEYLDRNRDAFNNDITNRTNVLDLPAHYPYSPERWRVTVDGARVFPQYGDVAQYNHIGDRHQLRPNAGETVTFESAERPRYVVAYELEASIAFGLQQELTGDDRIEVGLYDGSEGWYFEQTGAHDAGEGDFILERQGVEVYRNTDRDIRVPTTEFARLALQTAWYDISRQKWERSYAEQSTRSRGPDYIQQNPVVDTGGHPGESGATVANLPVHLSVTADPTTTDLVLEVGSAAQVNLGQTTQFNRSKKIFATDTIGVTNEWVPLRAFRVKPGREETNVQLSNVTAGKYSRAEDVEILMLAGDPTKVLDGAGDPLADADYSVPNETSGTNSVIRESTAVEQFPDNTGTPQASMVDPGGWQLARSELLSDSGRSLASTADIPVKAKRPLYSRDVAVVLGRSGSTGDVSYQMQTEQDW